MKTGLSRFWYRFKNWFRTKPGPGEPLTFLSGSKEELRRLTTWICHIQPQIFRSNSSVTVRYISSTKRAKGHAELPSFAELALNTPVDELLLVLKRCRFIFVRNEFTGTEWVKGPAGEEAIHVPEMMVSPEHFGLSMLTGIYEKPIYLDVNTNAPSAHERAEALLALSEWLDGKVSEEEKRELLQLPDDFEF